MCSFAVKEKAQRQVGGGLGEEYFGDNDNYFIPLDGKGMTSPIRGMVKKRSIASPNKRKQQRVGRGQVSGGSTRKASTVKG